MANYLRLGAAGRAAGALRAGVVAGRAAGVLRMLSLPRALCARLAVELGNALGRVEAAGALGVDGRG
jgi:hypothetical protein